MAFRAIERLDARLTVLACPPQARLQGRGV